MLFDTHTHPQMPQYDNDRDEVIKRALNAGVFMLCVGTDFKTSQEAISLAEKYNGIWASSGLHPNDIDYGPQNIEYGILNIEKFEELIQEPKVVAVGEVGLDYYRTTDPKAQEKQRRVLKQFIDLAVQYNKPLILHCRNGSTSTSAVSPSMLSLGTKRSVPNGSPQDAHKDLLDILNSRFQVPDSRLRGVIHSFTGTWQETRKYLDLDFYIGFNGIITFARQYDETIKKIPLSRILLETDAPFLTPEPYRGKRNESSYIEKICQKMADLRETDFQTVSRETGNNALKFLNLKRDLG